MPSAVRARLLAERGATGMILVEPKVPDGRLWADFARVGEAPGMYLAVRLRASGSSPLISTRPKRRGCSPGRGAASPSSPPLAEASQPLPGFALAPRLSARIATERRGDRTRNVVARLPGQRRAAHGRACRAHRASRPSRHRPPGQRRPDLQRRARQCRRRRGADRHRRRIAAAAGRGRAARCCSSR